MRNNDGFDISVSSTHCADSSFKEQMWLREAVARVCMRLHTTGPDFNRRMADEEFNAESACLCRNEQSKRRSGVQLRS